MKQHEEEEEENRDQAKFIAENFDMKCDCCDVIFTDFYDACRHYKESHGQNGYIKCVKDDFFIRNFRSYWIKICIMKLFQLLGVVT